MKWLRSYSVITTEVTKEQMWRLYSDVNRWHEWDNGIDYARMEGEFVKGNSFILKPKGGPKVKIRLVETIENKLFIDLTNFPLAKMYGEHSLEETKEGLKITTTMTVSGLLKGLWIKLVAQNIVDGLPEETQHQINIAKAL